MTTAQLWILALERLQVSMSQGNYSTWIRPMTLLSTQPVGDERVIAEIACPSTFHVQMVDKRYYGQLQEALESVSGKKIELRLKVDVSSTKTVLADSTPLFTITSQPVVDELSLAQHKIGLNEDFTFDTFAVSGSNEMAHAAAVAIAKKLGQVYNPLFLYGGVGVGKTHLMQAVANSALTINTKLPMIYCAGEQFTNEIIDAIQRKKTREFKQKYRNVKGLFIDDVQFIAGKTTVQEEFFHTFNAVLQNGGQVVMTSDRPPHEINNLEDRLRSRFEAGLLIDIGEPSFELRTAILLIKAKQRGIDLPMEAAQAVAANVDSARRLEGFLVRLAGEAKLKSREVSLELVQSILGKKAESPAGYVLLVRPMEVVREVAAHFQINPKDLRGQSRVKSLVMARQLAMYIMRFDLQLSLVEIGDLFGGRDHSTVIHSVDKMTTLLSESESLRFDLESVRKTLQSVGKKI